MYVSFLLNNQRYSYEQVDSCLMKKLYGCKPFLGICLVLHLLFDVSYEDWDYEGLGIVPGKVVRFEVPAGFKVPHMGWNQIENNDSQKSSDT